MKATKLKLTLASLLAAVIVLPLGGVVHAAGQGGTEGGDIYRVRNVTQGGDFMDPVGASKCETLQYKVRIHNPGPSPITSVNVKVNLPAGASTQNVSTATVSAADAFPTSTTDTATVNLTSSLKISYISGSTQLLGADNSVISSLPDGITAGGVTIGNVGVSINEKRFVQFKAKVDCPTPPPCVDNPKTPEDECNPCVDNPKTPQDECNPVTPPTPEFPGGSTSYPTGSTGVSELSNTGAGSIAGYVVAAVAAGIIAFRVYLGRRFANQ